MINKNNVYFIFILFFCAFTHVFSQAILSEDELIERGKNFLKSANFEEAIESFSQVLKYSLNQSYVALAHLYLAYTYFSRMNQGDEIRARDHLIKCIDINPEIYPDEKEFGTLFLKYFKELKMQTVGIAYFRSVPDKSKIFLDGNSLGITPIKKELAAKKYKLRAVKWGYTPIEIDIQIQSNEINDIVLNFQKERNWMTFVKSTLLMIVFKIALDRL